MRSAGLCELSGSDEIRVLDLMLHMDIWMRFVGRCMQVDMVMASEVGE